MGLFSLYFLAMPVKVNAYLSSTGAHRQVHTVDLLAAGFVEVPAGVLASSVKDQVHRPIKRIGHCTC